MQLILDTPMAPHGSGELLRGQLPAQDIVPPLQAGSPPGIRALRERPTHGTQVLPQALRIDTLRGREDRIGADLLTTMLSPGASKPATHGRFKTSHRSWGFRTRSLIL